MSSPYAILDNRPIDKWKVTELKEELKKRRLVTRGLKEDLVKRLDEAIRQEQEETERLNRAAAEEANQAAEMTPITGDVTPDRKQGTPIAAAMSTETTPSAAETPPSATETTPASTAANTTPVKSMPASAAVETTPSSTAAKMTPVKSMPASAAVETTPPPPVPANLQDEKVDDVRDIAGVDVKLQEPQELDVKDAEESEVTATSTVGAEEASSEHIVNKTDVEMENKNSITDLDDEGAKAQATDDKSATYNQVSQVSPVAGFEVKSDCISTDCVSNNEKIELKDNEIADNVKLEQNVNKSQEPSAIGGESHPMDVEEISVGGGNDNNSANADITKGNDIIIDAGDSEKLNLDRSSGDDSMEDEPETKQTESNNFDEVVDKTEKTKMPNDKEETHDEIMVNNDSAPENKSHQVVASEKRKLPVSDQEAVENNESTKRQRRWNSESIKVPEAQANNTAPTTTPRSTGLKRDFSRSDSSLSEDGPKERVVPPSPKEPTNSLRIDRFLRPFTLKAVQELLGKTGNVTSFWMDHIKTHCYVSYSSVEEAAATREAVYNLQWPPNGGRLLVAEFVGSEEVKAKLEAPLLPATTPQAAPSQPQPQLPPPIALPPPPPLAKLPPPVRERLPPPPPLVPEEQEPPIVTLDDLFKKTKAIPRIYYLPLSDEQVAAKLGARGNSKMASNNK